MVTLPGTAVETVIYDEYHPDQEEIMEIVLDWFYRPVNEDEEVKGQGEGINKNWI